MAVKNNCKIRADLSSKKLLFFSPWVVSILYNFLTMDNMLYEGLKFPKMKKMADILYILTEGFKILVSIGTFSSPWPILLLIHIDQRFSNCAPGALHRPAVLKLCSMEHQCSTKYFQVLHKKISGRQNLHENFPVFFFWST